MRLYQNSDKNPATVADGFQRLWFADLSGTFIEYECISVPRNLEKSTKPKNKRSDPVWQITKYKQVGNFVTEQALADGESAFNKRVDLRESYDYDIDE